MNDKPTVNIETRLLVTYNNDPQRRCYNGCHFSTATEWSAWEVLEYQIPAERAERRLTFWRELNAYAVKARGKENTLREYRIA